MHTYIDMSIRIYVRVARLCACIKCSDQASKPASREKKNEWVEWTNETVIRRTLFWPHENRTRNTNSNGQKYTDFLAIPTRLFASFKHAVCMFNLDEWLLSAPKQWCVHVWPSFSKSFCPFIHTHHRSTWKFKLRMPLWNAPAAFPAHFVKTKTTTKKKQGRVLICPFRFSHTRYNGKRGQTIEHTEHHHIAEHTSKTAKIAFSLFHTSHLGRAIRRSCFVTRSTRNTLAFDYMCAQQFL